MTALYDDGRYLVTASSFSTPNRIYPLAHATARVRSDPLWTGFAGLMVAGAAYAVYGDLLRPMEVTIFFAVPAALLALGLVTKVLALDAPGHTRVLIFGTRWKIEAVFKAIRRAGSADFSRAANIIEGREDFGN